MKAASRPVDERGSPIREPLARTFVATALTSVAATQRMPGPDLSGNAHSTWTNDWTASSSKGVAQPSESSPLRHTITCTAEHDDGVDPPGCIGAGTDEQDGREHQKGDHGDSSGDEGPLPWSCFRRFMMMAR